MKLLRLLIFLPSVVSQSNGNAISDTCSDGNLCFNGSTCTKLEKGFRSPIKGRTYRCDCAHLATTGTEFYAGYGCEHDATDYCIDGPYSTTDQKFEAFCTNGSCVQNFILGEGEKAIHPGCNCNAGYEGDFCEYELGTAPYKASNGYSIALGIILPLVLVVTGGGLLLKRRSNREKEVSSNAAPSLPVGELKVDHADVV